MSETAVPINTEVTPDRVAGAYTALKLAQELEAQAAVFSSQAKQDYDAAVAAYTLIGLVGKNAAERDAHLYGLVAPERQILEEAEKDLIFVKAAVRMAQTEVNMIQALMAFGRAAEDARERMAASLEILTSCIQPDAAPGYPAALNIQGAQY